MFLRISKTQAVATCTDILRHHLIFQLDLSQFELVSKKAGCQHDHYLVLSSSTVNLSRTSRRSFNFSAFSALRPHARITHIINFRCSYFRGGQPIREKRETLPYENVRLRFYFADLISWFASQWNPLYNYC